jgi:hypothetical protein
MDAYSRNLEEEELLEEIIKDAPDVEPAESPSGDGMEADEAGDDEADGAGDCSDDGEGDSSADGEAGGELTKSGEVYI